MRSPFGGEEMEGTRLSRSLLVERSRRKARIWSHWLHLPEILGGDTPKRKKRKGNYFEAPGDLAHPGPGAVSVSQLGASTVVTGFILLFPLRGQDRGELRNPFSTIAFQRAL